MGRKKKTVIVEQETVLNETPLPTNEDNAGIPPAPEQEAEEPVIEQPILLVDGGTDVDDITDTPELVMENEGGVIISDVEVPITETETVEPAPAVNERTNLRLVVTQHEDGQEVTKYGIGFTLDGKQALQLDVVIGTALNELFKKMDLAKTMTTRLFKSKLPLELAVTSDQFTLDFGRVDQVFLNKMKLNNGERSRLNFIDKVIAITTSLLAPIESIRATELRENAKQNVMLAYPDAKHAPKGLASTSSIMTLAKSVLMVDDKK